MKEIQLVIPRDVLRALIDGKQSNVPFVIQGDGEPLRIVLYVAQQATPQSKFFKKGRG